MPTIFSHAIFASAVGKAATPKFVPLRFWMLTALCAMLPDADVLGFSLGVRYGSILGHRGLTHSIAFAALVGVITGAICHHRMGSHSFGKLAFYFALITVSHPLLDMLTNGGLGVALFAPLSAKRYFFPWRPIEVSPIGVGFLSQRGWSVLVSEMIWVWLPAFVVLVAALIYRRVFGGGKQRVDPQGYA